MSAAEFVLLSVRDGNQGSLSRTRYDYYIADIKNPQHHRY